MESPLSANELKQLLGTAELKPKDILRKNESAYHQHVAGRELSDAQVIDLMVKYPELIQRPIVVRGNKAVLAGPVEKLSKLGIE